MGRSSRLISWSGLGRGWMRWAVVVVMALAAGPGLVLADEVVNDVVNNRESVTIQPGETATVRYWLVVNDNATDPVNGCNVNSGNPATLSFSLPTGVTAAFPDGTEFVACDDPATPAREGSLRVAFSSATAGSYTVPDALVNGGRTQGGQPRYNAATTDFSLIVEVASPRDITPPVITPMIDGIKGTNDWYTSDVTVVWTVTDAESAISSQPGCDPVAVTTDQQATTYTCTATSAGGTDSKSVTIKRDATTPEISFVGSSDTVRDGGQYDFGFVPGKPTCSATDLPSGIDADGCAVKPSTIPTAVGTHTITAVARDAAGNEGKAKLTYEVVAWTVRGFFSPVDMNGILNVVKAGSTVPLKFQVSRTVEGSQITDPGMITGLVVGSTNCTNPRIGESDIIPLSELVSGGTALRYDPGDEQFIQNWKTPKVTGCYKAVLKTDDGEKLVAFFRLR
jgi:hypothetical protein